MLDILGDELHAMIDVSDGLGRDVARVAVASDVSVELDGSALPCAPGATWRQAIGDGEDYELCFTVGGAIEVPDVLADVPLTCVGTCAPAGDGPPVMVRTPEGELQDAGVMGWDHGA